MKLATNCIVATLSASAAVLLTTLLTAGPLDPPPGPVASSYKTLADIEPRTPISAATTPGDADSLFKITQPGSYYLTGNITGVPSKHGIEIVASGVTLDLEGFDMAGVPGMGSFDGVSVTASGLRSITVLNGSIRNWADKGVDYGLNAIDSTIRDIRVGGNGGHGLRVADGGRIIGCTAYDNAGDGLVALGSGCTITDCTAHNNGGSGVSEAVASTITNVTVYANHLDGMFVRSFCTVTACTARFNGVDGISVGQGSLVTACVASNNGFNGIIAISDGGTISNCTANSNARDGVLVDVNCAVTGNLCVLNGSASGSGLRTGGIHATGSGNRIEGNNCVSNDRGIDIEAAGNVIVRNTCRGNNQNWVIVANNIFGPIVDRTSPGSPAVSGSSAASTLATTDPNANFSY